MTRDGVEPVVPWRLKQDGWRDISTAPIATPDLVDLDAGIDISVDPAVIEGLTLTGLCVLVVYDARGDYQDRWVSVRNGRTMNNLAYWRPLAA